jgi:hypothetical protein
MKGPIVSFSLTAAQFRHDLSLVPECGPSMKPYSSEVLLINVFSVADSENEDLVSQDSVDHPVIADAIFPKTCELSFEDWIDVSVLRKLFLDLREHAANFCLGQLLKVTLN